MKKLLVILFLITSTIFSQIYTQKDVEVCNSKFDFAAKEELQNKPIGDVIVEIGKTFLGTDYEAFTLEKGNDEELVVHLTGLDCYTFFESSLALARAVKKGVPDFDSYQNELQKIRYRNGEMKGYPSRLHYASDWLFENDKAGIVKNITKEIGGVPYADSVYFMSANKIEYRQMNDNDDIVEKIKEIETEINDRENYFIPQNEIGESEDKIKNGDIILITSSIDGLDIAHTGIAVENEEGIIHFMHAPIVGQKVQLTKEPLSVYVQKNKSQSGIMVARPIEPGG